MTLAERITVDPAVMGGRIEILFRYPYLEPDDIRAALEYAAWRVDELERPFSIGRAPTATLS